MWRVDKHDTIHTTPWVWVVGWEGPCWVRSLLFCTVGDTWADP